MPALLELSFGRLEKFVDGAVRARRQKQSTTDRECVKTSLENYIEKIYLTESRTRDDHRTAKGLRYLIFDVTRTFFGVFTQARPIAASRHRPFSGAPFGQ
jgi:hypothetical protein